MYKILIIVLFALLIVGCKLEPTTGKSFLAGKTVVDQCLRLETFKECMKLVPKGPEVVEESDWSDIISNCSQFAYYASLRQAGLIKDGCRTRPLKAELKKK
jgi:hypothetical protein